jgi:hypothetical protein
MMPTDSIVVRNDALRQGWWNFDFLDNGEMQNLENQFMVSEKVVNVWSNFHEYKKGELHGSMQLKPRVYLNNFQSSVVPHTKHSPSSLQTLAR